MRKKILSLLLILTIIFSFNITIFAEEFDLSTTQRITGVGSYDAQSLSFNDFLDIIKTNTGIDIENDYHYWYYNTSNNPKIRLFPKKTVLVANVYDSQYAADWLVYKYDNDELIQDMNYTNTTSPSFTYTSYSEGTLEYVANTTEPLFTNNFFICGNVPIVANSDDAIKYLKNGDTSVLLNESLIVEKTQFNNIGTQGVSVGGVINPDFTVTVPKIITLNEDGVANYSLNIQGNISEYANINVVPQEEFLLKRTAGEVQLAKTSQNTTSWTANEILAENGVNVTGEIYTTSRLNPGIWSGSFYFNVFMSYTEVGSDSPYYLEDVYLNEVTITIPAEHSLYVNGNLVATSGTYDLGPGEYQIAFVTENSDGYVKNIIVLSATSNNNSLTSFSITDENNVLVTVENLPEPTLTMDCTDYFINEYNNTYTLYTFGAPKKYPTLPTTYVYNDVEYEINNYVLSIGNGYTCLYCYNEEDIYMYQNGENLKTYLKSDDISVGRYDLSQGEWKFYNSHIQQAYNATVNPSNLIYTTSDTYSDDTKATLITEGSEKNVNINNNYYAYVNNGFNVTSKENITMDFEYYYLKDNMWVLGRTYENYGKRLLYNMFYCDENGTLLTASFNDSTLSNTNIIASSINIYTDDTLSELCYEADNTKYSLTDIIINSESKIATARNNGSNYTIEIPLNDALNGINVELIIE